MLKYLSHLELLKVFDRALRRAGLPVAFSQGFNPHPKISFASALAVGVASRTEYMEVEFSEALSPQLAMTELAAQLPDGIELLYCSEVEEKAAKMMAEIERARYQVELKLREKLSAEEIGRQIAAVLDSEVLNVRKEGKNAGKIKNIRPGIENLEINKLDSANLTLEMLVAAGSKNNVRPEEVIHILAARIPQIDLFSAKITRTGLFCIKDGQLSEPLG